jgi:hypothetical protein
VVLAQPEISKPSPRVATLVRMVMAIGSGKRDDRANVPPSGSASQRAA